MSPSQRKGSVPEIGIGREGRAAVAQDELRHEEDEWKV